MSFYSKHIFSRVLDWSLGLPAVQEQRRELLAGLEGSGLEIGFGTGLNLMHYPRSVTRLTIIDPEIMLAERVRARIAQAHMPVEQMQLDASGRLPFDDGSFDFVVSTFTLCTIAEPLGALAEIGRVLRREGRFVFLEHGRSDDPGVAKRQDFFNPLHKLLACGCNMNRPIDRIIQRAGLHITSLDRFLMPDAPRILAEMYRGAARCGGK